MDVNRFSWWCRFYNNGLGGEIKGNAKHISVFGVEQAVLIGS